MQSVQSGPSNSTAVAERYNNLLISPSMTYNPAEDDSEALEAQAVDYGKRMTNVLVEDSGAKLDAYVNYACGDESLEARY